MHARHVSRVAGHVGRLPVSHAVVHVARRSLATRHVLQLVIVSWTVLKGFTGKKYTGYGPSVSVSDDGRPLDWI